MFTATSLRLRIVLAFVLSVIAGPIEKVTGLENIAAVKNHRFIIATSHVSNLDMLAAISVLAKYFKLEIINKSLHYSLFRRPTERIAMSVAGPKNFLPISYHNTDNEPRFIPADFVPMKKALEKGRVVMIAAHNPATNWKLPATAGYGAVYLAEIAQPCLIMPVSVVVQSDQPAGMIDILPQSTWRQKIKAFWRRPAIHVHIYPPMQLSPLPNLERFQNLATRHDNLSGDEKKEFSALREARRAEGWKIMQVIASAY